MRTRRSLYALAIRAHIALLLALPLAPACLEQTSAQSPPATFSMDKDREPMVLMDGLWRFHPGDDPKWAAPNFDDSSWPLIRGDKGWSKQGYEGMSGLAWYRVKVLIPEGEGPLLLYVPDITTSYQVFADGQPIGGLGGMPPHEHAYLTTPTVYALPVTVSNQARTVTIAVRVWHWPDSAKWRAGGLRRGIWIGQARLIRERGAVWDNERAWNQVTPLFLAMLESLAGLAALTLFVLRPREKEYLWFGAMMLLQATGRFFDLYIVFHTFGATEHDVVKDLIWGGSELASIAFYFRLLQGKRNSLFWMAIGSIAIISLLPLADFLFVNPALENALAGVLFIPITVWMLTLLFRQSVRGLPDARLLLGPVLLQQMAWIADAVLWAALQTGRYRISVDWLESTWQRPFPISPFDTIDVMFLIATLAILVRRFNRTSKQEERFATEFEAARIVQQVIIPEALPTVPGFQIQSVYKPAGQVGGDFFQILATKEGGVLVCIGDVSGKGMPAAMTVSLLVGTVRTLAHYSQSPGEILAAMNQRMLARSRGGFTTCLVLRADPDGTLFVANAGHLAPYRNGEELRIENGLPLGVDSNTTYPESTFHLAERESLTLLTDGVVEARTKSGELFGFERTAALSTEPAEKIAQTAQAFGQDDDITVLTVTRVAVDEQSTTQLSTTVMSQVSA
jgi:hypothetical protein